VGYGRPDSPFSSFWSSWPSIGLLAGFVAPLFSQVGKSQVKAAKAQVDALDKAVETVRGWT